MAKKLFAGHVLRKIREHAGMSQVNFARRLDLSASYVNQLESNTRPVSASVLIAVSREFGADMASFEANDLDRLVADLGEAFADKRFYGGVIGLQDLKSVATHSPDFAHAVLDLYGALLRMSEQQASMEDAFSIHGDRAENAKALPSAYDEVRDHFHYIDNYVDELDVGAEDLAERLGLAWHHDRFTSLAAWLAENHNISVELTDFDGRETMSEFSRSRRVVSINRFLPRSTMDFLLACVVADVGAYQLIDTHIASAGFSSPAAEDICRLALRNYYAGALLLPYRRILSLAKDHRHDLDRMAATTGSSLEQICHRLSTLQRNGEKGIPIYFLKVDRAGNVIKRHSATRFQFARYGGACPVWNVHEAFERLDNRTAVQIGEMPDGHTYLCLARSVSKPAPEFGKRERRYAFGLGCELKYAEYFVYADGLSISDKARATPIGINCRICPRTDCSDRAFPALGKGITVDSSKRGIVPFSMR